jgi:hypothetical protein
MRSRACRQGCQCLYRLYPHPVRLSLTNFGSGLQRAVGYPVPRARKCLLAGSPMPASTLSRPGAFEHGEFLRRFTARSWCPVPHALKCPLAGSLRLYRLSLDPVRLSLANSGHGLQCVVGCSLPHARRSLLAGSSMPVPGAFERAPGLGNPGNHRAFRGRTRVTPIMPAHPSRAGVPWRVE